MKEKEQIHFCNTCRHSDKQPTEEPCKSCVPAKFGGKDKWEAVSNNGTE